MQQKKADVRKLPSSERRELVALGVAAGKSRRLLAAELGVTDQTIRRDLEALGIKDHRKPTVTKRTKTTGREIVEPESSGARALDNGRSEPHSEMPPAAKKDVKRKIVFPRMPESLRRRDLSPEERRQQRLQEMVQLVHFWLDERPPGYSRAVVILEKARNRLNASSNAYFRGISESSMSAAELRDQNRPQELDSARSEARREEVYAQWLAR